MNPTVEQVHMGVAMALGGDVLPHLQVPYMAGHVSMSAALSVMAAQEADRAVERRAREIAGMKALFAAALDLVDDPDLRQQLQAAADESPSDLRVSSLNRARRAMLPALVDLHVWLEGRQTSPARALLIRLLDHLADTAEGRALFLPPSA